MLMRALKMVPGTIQIHPDQEFHELDLRQAEIWIKDGIAVPAVREDLGWSGIRWTGCEVLIIASGPSLTTEQVAAARTWREASATRRVIVINTSFQLAPWADALYACDARWWRAYYDEVLRCFQGQLWSQTEGADPKFENVKLIKSQRSPGLNKEPGTINTGMHSGYQAINLAWQAGSRKIYLLGYDVKDTGGQSHWHGDHPKAIRAKSMYATWLINYRQLAKDLLADTEVINLTPGSALKAFPQREWGEVLA